MTTPTPLVANIVVQATANAGGTATATFPSFNVGKVRVVTQVAISTTSVGVPTAKLNYNGQLVTQSPLGNGDTASGDPPVEVRYTDTLSVTWTGCDVGAQCTAIYYYQEVRKDAR